MGVLKLHKITEDGRYVFTKDGVYFALTNMQMNKMQKIIEELKNVWIGKYNG